MKKHTITTYSFSELSEEAKENALNNWIENNQEIFWQYEILESLKSLFDTCYGVSLYDYSLGLNNSWLSISCDYDTGELQGKRAIAWLENNLLSHLRIPFVGKKRWELAQYGKYYRPGMIEPCPFTGYCADENFLYALITDIKKGSTLQDAFEGLASEYQKILNNEYEHQQSEDFFQDHALANDLEFTEDGEIY